jgi:hypothetical protein
MKKLLFIAYYLNLLAFIYCIVPFFLVAFLKIRQIDITYLCYFSTIGRVVFSIILLGILFLWYNNIVYLLKYDKNNGRLLLLIFFSWIYSPIYFIKRYKYKDVYKH